MAVKTQEINSLKKGLIAETKVISRFVELGHGVAQPIGGFHRYDILVDIGSTNNWKRVQIKTASIRNGCVGFPCVSHRADRSRTTYSVVDIDYVVAYCSDNNKYYIVPVAEITRSEMKLRIMPAKNNMVKGVRDAKLYEL